MNPINPYIDDLLDWKGIVRNKHILFDSSVIIKIIKFSADSLLDEFKDLNVVNCYIHPVYAELQSTNNSKERLRRLNLLNKYNFITLPLRQEQHEEATAIQAWAASEGYYPPIIDLYLAGSLAGYKHDKILFFTGDAKDFRYPLFIRKTAIILQSKSSSQLLHLLQLNHEELEHFKERI